jgi:intein/homing endonuclease
MTKHISAAVGHAIGRVRRASSISIPTDSLQLAYLAGIIDGEGCVSRQESSSSWTVAVTNTSSELEKVLGGIGGLFYYPPRRASLKFDGTLNKQRFEWKVCRAWDVLELLEALAPYLVIKKDRAAQAIDEIRERFGDRPETLS